MILKKVLISENHLMKKIKKKIKKKRKTKIFLFKKKFLKKHLQILILKKK
jgi:hypothetical protein